MSLRILAVALPGILIFHVVVVGTLGESPGTDWYDLMPVVGLQIALLVRVGSTSETSRLVRLNLPCRLVRRSLGEGGSAKRGTNRWSLVGDS